MTEFVIKITSVRTTDFPQAQDFVKQVDFTLEGKRDNQTFMLPISKRFEDPASDVSGYTPFSSLTEQQVTDWVAGDEEFLKPYKAHIDIVLDKMVTEAALSQKPMPWAPAAPTPTPETTPPAMP